MPLIAEGFKAWLAVGKRHIKHSKPTIVKSGATTTVTTAVRMAEHQKKFFQIYWKKTGTPVSAWCIVKSTTEAGETYMATGEPATQARSTAEWQQGPEGCDVLRKSLEEGSISLGIYAVNGEVYVHQIDRYNCKAICEYDDTPYLISQFNFIAATPTKAAPKPQHRSHSKQQTVQPVRRSFRLNPRSVSPTQSDGDHSSEESQVPLTPPDLMIQDLPTPIQRDRSLPPEVQPPRKKRKVRELSNEDSPSPSTHDDRLFTPAPSIDDRPPSAGPSRSRNRHSVISLDSNSDEDIPILRSPSFERKSIASSSSQRRDQSTENPASESLKQLNRLKAQNAELDEALLQYEIQDQKYKRREKRKKLKEWKKKMQKRKRDNRN